MNMSASAGAEAGSVLLAPRSATSTRYHRPVASGALRPACGGFRAGYAIPGHRITDLRLSPCGNCWADGGSAAADGDREGAGGERA